MLHNFLKTQEINQTCLAVMSFSRSGFVELLSPTSVAQQNVSNLISVTIMNLVTPKAAAEHELLLNELTSGLPNIGK
jgi:hypothetical protein